MTQYQGHRTSGKDNGDHKVGSGYGYVTTCRIAKGINVNCVCPVHRTTARVEHSRVNFGKYDPPLCPTCREPMVAMNERVRVPKKSASNRTWKKFFKLFANHVETHVAQRK